MIPRDSQWRPCLADKHVGIGNELDGSERPSAVDEGDVRLAERESAEQLDVVPTPEKLHFDLAGATSRTAQKRRHETRPTLWYTP